MAVLTLKSGDQLSVKESFSEIEATKLDADMVLPLHPVTGGVVRLKRQAILDVKDTVNRVDNQQED